MLVLVLGGDGGGGAVDTIDDVRHATVLVRATGEIVDPQVGQRAVSGHGTAFTIDPSGIAVTNNHVVVGAGKLQVIVGDVFENGAGRATSTFVLGAAPPGGDYIVFTTVGTVSDEDLAVLDQILRTLRVLE